MKHYGEVGSPPPPSEGGILKIEKGGGSMVQGKEGGRGEGGWTEKRGGETKNLNGKGGGGGRGELGQDVDALRRGELEPTYELCSYDHSLC